MSWTLATFNVNGIRARLPLLLDWLAARTPSVVCLQETKVTDADFPRQALTETGYVVHCWGQKSFNGVAVLSKSQPQEVRVGFDGGQAEDQARLLSVLVDGVWVVNCYVPQGREVGDPAFVYKLEFLARLRDWLQASFKPRQRYVLTGDMNVAPADIDVFDPKRMAGKVGCHPDERRALAELSKLGLSDCFRLHHPDVKQFTFWDYRLPKSFERNLGWRLDLVLASRPLAKLCASCEVDVGPRGLAKPSDHTPVLASFDLGQG
ncbi:MAG: exodeoxyribonuclease III [Thermodesulfobacteriota bacterium]